MFLGGRSGAGFRSRKRRFRRNPSTSSWRTWARRDIIVTSSSRPTIRTSICYARRVDRRATKLRIDILC